MTVEPFTQPTYRIIEPDLGITTDIYRDRGRLLQRKRSGHHGSWNDIECRPHYVVSTFDNEVVVEAWTTQHYNGSAGVFDATETAEAYEYAQRIAQANKMLFDPAESAKILTTEMNGWDHDVLQPTTLQWQSCHDTASRYRD